MTAGGGTVAPVDIGGAVCVITGGGHGIGAALARRFAAEGAAGVVVVDHDGPAAEAVAATLPADGGLALELDVTDEDAHHRAVALAATRFGPVDLYGGRRRGREPARRTVLILPHPEVADFERARATDRDAWLAGMRRLQARLDGPAPVAS